ncbi:MFS general substrate transporter [Hymenopellis radicata]|nr:MFS general substrate transporter [Hymenopellis radicata]
MVLTAYFIPYCIFECPVNLALKKLRPSRCIPGLALLWGITLALTGIVQTYPQLLGLRVALGAVEAGLFPGISYYLTFWYPRHLLQLRLGYFVASGAIGCAFSGLLASVISRASGVGGLLGWSWIFIAEGAISTLGAVLAFFAMADLDFPSTASFLDDEEKDFLRQLKAQEQSTVGDKGETFSSKYIYAALSDWQVWLHTLIFLSCITPYIAITLFLPIIIKTFGYSSLISELLSVPPYVFATIVVIAMASASDRYKLRSPFIFGGLLVALVGFIINITDAPSGVKYFGTFLCVSGSYGALPGVVVWLGNNLSGQYKRAVGMALHIGLGNFGGVVAGNIYRSQDSPRFILGHGITIMFLVIGMVCTPLVAALYARINARRQSIMDGAGEKSTSLAELRYMGDKAPDFKYTL